VLGCVSFLLFAGCSRYEDFTLQRITGGNPNNLTFRFEEHPGPVLRRDREHDVLNPSLAAGHNFYSLFDGHTWHTGHAVLKDAVWEKTGIILSPDARTWEGSYIAANGAALYTGGRFWIWYVAGPRERPSIGLARSPDAQTWSKEAQAVLDPGPYESWDEYGVADPYVIRMGDYFYLYYLGQDRARRQRLGVARSTDGIHWMKLRSNPMLEPGGSGAFDENGLGEPAVWISHGFYWMLYTGRDTGEMRRLGLARSTDGVHWTKLPVVFSGSQAWDSKVMCDPEVELNGTEIRVWFGGGDVARPDENLNGQIGFGLLRITRAAKQ
jgi:sucrose-6-phosphate hydrolase SacC (GH32 family)